MLADAQEVSDYNKQYHWDDSNAEAVRSPTFVYPQLHRLEGLTNHPVLPMNPTATCEVTVLDEDKQPIPNSKVSFWPNQYFFLAGSNVVGDGIDSLTYIRERLKSGQKVKPDFTTNRNRYTVTTDAQGKATISNLPAGLAGASPRKNGSWLLATIMWPFQILKCPNSVCFLPIQNWSPLSRRGKPSAYTIRMKKRPAKSTAPAHE